LKKQKEIKKVWEGSRVSKWIWENGEDIVMLFGLRDLKRWMKGSEEKVCGSFLMMCMFDRLKKCFNL